MEHKLPDLPYSYDALEPHIDSQTMEIHHTKHHQGYVDKLNKALEGHDNLKEMSLEDLLSDIQSIPEDIRTSVRNNGGGHYNHSLFWTTMSPPQASSGQAEGGGEPEGELADEIKSTFGSFEKFKEEFSNTATSIFGSGWAWLVINDGNLKIETTANQGAPIMHGTTPLLGLDMWEHSFYLKWGPQKTSYVKNWWKVVNWQKVEEFYSKAK